jgi:uncharacterized protein YbjQ (UPF0145 family)
VSTSIILNIKYNSDAETSTSKEGVRVFNKSMHSLKVRGLIVGSLIAISSIGIARTAESADENFVQTVPSIMMTTTEGFEGYRIKQYKGIIRGVTVRVPGPVSNFKASLKSVVGGKIGPYVRMCEVARQQAMDALVVRAQEVGANAVVGFRYDSSAYGDGDEMGSEVVCYGTAVVIAPRDDLKTASSEH